MEDKSTENGIGGSQGKLGVLLMLAGMM